MILLSLLGFSEVPPAVGYYYRRSILESEMGSPLGFAGTRHRLSASINDMYKTKLGRSKAKLFRKTLDHCKFLSLKLLLAILICGTSITLLCSPRSYNDHTPTSAIRHHFVSRWIWGGSYPDHRYISNLDVDWDNIAKVTTELKSIRRIGLLNFNEREMKEWKRISPDAGHVVLNLNYVGKNVTWDGLYPEWIDEEEERGVPVCPSFPEVEAPGKRIDLVAVKLPCRRDGKWRRDVARLHLQLAAARVAASTKGKYAVHLLFVTECFPMVNMFTCKELVARHGDVWLYKPDPDVLRDKLRLPVGSCELALPLGDQERVRSRKVQREAYATILHSAHVYVCGAIAAAQSIRMSGSTRDLVILVDKTIRAHYKSGLEAAGWKVRIIERIRNPKAKKDAYNEWNYSKFRLWQLTDYDKIIFIDADMLILRNIDFLFQMPEVSATGNSGALFNSGVMVIEPSNCTFHLLMEHINEIESYNGGDQGYLNEIFTRWHRIPKHMNYLKHFWVGDSEKTKTRKTYLFGAEPPVLYVLHYLGFKPWLCFRDYDCNWNNKIMREFASDVAHTRWWKVHDSMPENLQQFCLLKSKQKAKLEWDRRKSEKANNTDGHWKIEVKDPRLEVCVDKFCIWEDMLRHWGEKNRTDKGLSAPSPPETTLTHYSSS